MSWLQKILGKGTQTSASDPATTQTLRREDIQNMRVKNALMAAFPKYANEINVPILQPGKVKGEGFYIIDIINSFGRSNFIDLGLKQEEDETVTLPLQNDFTKHTHPLYKTLMVQYIVKEKRLEEALGITAQQGIQK